MLLEAPTTKTSQIFHLLSETPRRGSWSKNNQTPQSSPTAPSVCTEERCSRAPCPSTSSQTPSCPALRAHSVLVVTHPSHNTINLLSVHERRFSQRIKQRNWRSAINSSTSFQPFRSDQSLQDYKFFSFLLPAVLQKTINFSFALGNINPRHSMFWHCQCTWQI